MKKLFNCPNWKFKLPAVFFPFILHCCLFIVLYTVLYQLGYKNVIPNNANMIQFDAYWYLTIKEQGYVYIPGVGNNLAFFPLFPIFWKLTTLDAFFISLLNFVIFSLSFLILIGNQVRSFGKTMLILSFPSFIFFALPYSESLFFLFSTFIILGYRRKSNMLLYTGLFFSSMVRSVCVIFIPALIICEFVTMTKAISTRNSLLNLSYKLIASISGFLVAMIYIAWKTGTWFYFIEIQQYWNRHWIWPSFPLTTMHADRVLGVDGVAFIFGLISIFICFKLIMPALRISFATWRQDFKVKPEIIFSLLYLSGITLLDFLFTHHVNGLTNIWSLNRHLMATPFAVIFIIYCLDNYNPSFYEKIGICLLIISGVYFLGIYHHLNLVYFYIFYFFTVIILKIKPNWEKYTVFYYIIALFLQVRFYEEFLLGLWLG